MRDAVGISVFTGPDVIRKLRRIAPTLVAALLAIAYLIVGPTGADLPAQLLRVKLFGAEGFGIWNNWWYGGHDVTAYSVLFPPLAWLITPQLLAALASVGTAAAFEALAHDAYGDDAWIGATWLGAGTVTELLSGRLTFALGLCAVAVTALLLERRRPRWAAATAVLAALASPVAALFAALAGATVAARGLLRRENDYYSGVIIVLAALVPVVALAVAFPEGGSEPFTFATLWPVLAAGVAVLLLAPGLAISTATALYLLGCLVAYLVATPVGSNAARLGELVAGPLVALLLVPRRWYLLLALAAIPLTYVQIHNAIGDLQHGEPDNTAAYYRPLLRYLDSRPGAAQHRWRVEVPFTAGHWEAYRLAPEIPLARGWERQLDIAYDRLFYGGRLTASTYETWLHQLAVRYVAVADARPDYSSGAEVRLIRRGLAYLKVVARLPHWTVYAVAGATPIATGAARVTYMGPNSLTLSVRHPGSALVRVRWSPYWQLDGVRGCVAPDGDFTRIQARGSGRARLTIAFSLGRIGERSARCN